MNLLYRYLDESNISNLTDNFEEKNSNCEMFDGFGFLIQGILDAAAFSVLILKRFLKSQDAPGKNGFMM